MSKPIRRRQKSKINIKLFIGLVPSIFATVVLVNLILSMQRGEEQQYIDTLQHTWEQAIILTREYDSLFTKWKNGELNDTEMIDITYKSIDDREQLISTLNATKPPERLKVAHEYIISSLTYEKESNNNLIKYIESGDKQYLEKSDELFQRSFEYESKALIELSKAGVNIGGRGTQIIVGK